MKIFSFSERKKQFLFFVLILTLSSIVSDLYVSSFLEMSLKLETTMNGVQWSLSLFVIMLALSHLVYGALAERFGRKKMLLLGLAISFLGSLLCAASINIFDLLVGRVLQGFGVGACVVLWREMAHERYGESSLLKESFYLMPVSVAIMILVPLLGGLIQTYLGWKANFVYILFHVFFVFLFVYFFYQENMEKKATDFKYFSFSFYKELLRQKTFMAYSICVFLSYGAFFTWTGSGTVVLMGNFRLTPYELGLAMVLTAFPLSFSSFVYGGFLKKCKRNFIFRLAHLGMIFPVFFLMIIDYLGEMSVWLFLFLICIFMFFSGFFWPIFFNSFLKSLKEESSRLVALSLYGFFQFMGAGIIGVFLSFMTRESPFSIGFIMFICVLFSTFIYELLIARDEK